MMTAPEPRAVHPDDHGLEGKRAWGGGNSGTVGARDRDGHSAALVAVGNTGRCPWFNADFAGPGGRLSAGISALGVATPDKATGCVGVSAECC